VSTGTTAAVRWVDAADLGELWEGDVLDVEVADEHVLLVRLLGGEVRAYQGLCPRGGAGINPAGYRLYSYPVEITGDRVRVGIPQDGLRHYHRGPGSSAPGT
jgi:toluene monooxygenase system ferredoxin subunit